MAFPFTPSKRPYERNLLEPNGRGKWQKTAPLSVTQQNQLKVPPGTVILRVLCHSSKFGSIIGKGGGIVAKIRKETGAKIRIEDSVPGCEERVVVIIGSEKEAETSQDQSKEGNKESGTADGGGEEIKESTENDEEKVDSSALEVPKSEKPMSSAQKALLLVYDRLVEGEKVDDAGIDEGSKSGSKSSPFSAKLLILSSQVGCVLGKDESVIKQMSSDSEAQIQILPKDKLPLCASPNDEVVQIDGVIDSVKKALHLVSQLLLDNPPCESDSFPAAKPSGPSSHAIAVASFPGTDVVTPAKKFPPSEGPPFSKKPFDNAGYQSNIPPSFARFHDGPAAGPMQVPPEPITYKLLCPNDKAGSVIGKGGSIIRTIHHETGCDIKVNETADPEDKIIVISGTALPGDRTSSAQDAVLRVQERIVPDNKESNVLSRLVVSANQTGCLIGKGGAIIAEMRKSCGAQIRILGKDQIPKSVSGNDEVVQVMGELRAVQDALFQITTRLRHHLFRDNHKVPPMNHTAHPFDPMPTFLPYAGRREPSPPRMYSNLPPPFHTDSVGHPHDERPTFPRSTGVPPHVVERLPPAPWAPQGMRDSGGSMPMPDFGGGTPQRRLGGFPSGNPPVITNTTVEVVVPRALVPSIYGEDGFCLRRIREISEAKITITEPRPEATETVIIISGTPEQTHAAQSLLQAFVLSESGGH